MHNLYVFRQMFAQYFFAKYQMVRVDTWVEDKIFIASKGTLPKMEESFSFNIPGSLIQDKLGNFDFEASLEKEKTTHNIKAHLSAIPFGRQNAAYLFSLFWDATIKEMVPRFYDKEIIQVCERIMTEIGLFLSKEIYYYLVKGYSLMEAKNNVLNQVYKQLQTNKYFSNLEEFHLELLKIIQGELSVINALERETVEIIADEFWAIFVVYFERKIFFPTNYYALTFRMADKKREIEKDFTYLIDSTLIENDGKPWDIPVETYAIELTTEARQKNFEFITNGFENSLYTLNDYLYIYS